MSKIITEVNTANELSDVTKFFVNSDGTLKQLNAEALTKLFEDYVPQTREIAGISMEKDITANELTEALGINEWKLIKTIEITDSSLSYYIITTDEDGNSFECEEILVKADALVKDTGNSNYRIDIMTTAKPIMAGLTGAVILANEINNVSKYILSHVKPLIGTTVANIESTVKMDNANYASVSKTLSSCITSKFGMGKITYVRVGVSADSGKIEIYGKVK